MTAGIEIEAVRCAKCKSTNVHSFRTVEIDAAAQRRGIWELTGRIVNCAGCGRDIPSVSKLVEVEGCAFSACQDCGKSEYLQRSVNRIEKQSPGEWLFEVSTYCTGAGCRFRRMLSRLTDISCLTKIAVSFDGIEFGWDCNAAIPQQEPATA